LRSKLRLVKIGSEEEKKKKKIVLLDAGIHAREWISTAATLAFIHRLHFYSLLKSNVKIYQKQQINLRLIIS
jgi:hypothetical protein